jgi:hypothetical protein
MTVRSVGAELFHAKRRTDGRMDMTKLIVAFREFANVPKNIQKMMVVCSQIHTQYKMLFLDYGVTNLKVM